MWEDGEEIWIQKLLFRKNHSVSNLDFQTLNWKEKIVSINIPMVELWRHNRKLIFFVISKRLLVILGTSQKDNWERSSLQFFYSDCYYCNCTTTLGRMEKYFGWPFLFIYWTFVLLLARDTIDSFQAERHFICLDRFLVKAKKIIISF